jgi:tetratricopeptide (TPR) repeat protein
MRPDDMIAVYNIGLIYFKMKKYQEAVPYFKKVIDRDNEYIEAYSMLGKVYCYLEDYNEAIQYYKKAIDIEPNYTELYIGLGATYCIMEDYDKAIPYFQTAIDFDNNPRAYHNMGKLYGELGNEEKQISYYKKSAQLGDEDAKKWLTEHNHTWQDNENKQNEKT